MEQRRDEPDGRTDEATEPRGDEDRTIPETERSPRPSQAEGERETIEEDLADRD